MKKILIVICLYALFSCNREEIMLFDPEAGSSAAIRFDVPDHVVTTTFMTRKSDYLIDTVRLLVKTSGAVADYERTFKLEQLVEYPEFTYLYDEHGNKTDSVIDAKSGVHYRGLEDPYTAQFLKIGRGETSVEVPVLLLRNEELEKKPYRIKLRLLPNEEFATDFAEEFSVQTIFFSDIAVKPRYWDKDALYFFGSYSAVKIRFMIDNSNIDLAGDALLSLQAGDFLYYQKQLTKKLNEYNTGKPDAERLKDENGNYIMFQYGL